MELLLSFAIMATPNLVGGYYAYLLSKVRGYNVLFLTAAGFILGPLVPLFIYLVKPKEPLDHPWYPENNTFSAPALLRDPNSTNLMAGEYNSVPGHIYLEDERVIWIPKNGEPLEWDYAYVIHNGQSRTFKSERLTWLLLPNYKNSEKPYALSLGGKSSVGRLSIAALQNVIKNEDKELFERIMAEIRANSKWLRKKNDSE